MKHLLLLPLVFLLSPARADIKSTITSVVSLKVDPSYSINERLGTSLTVSGTNVVPTKTGGDAGSIGSLVLSTQTAGVPSVVDTTFTVSNAAQAFTMTESLTVGDSIPTVLSTAVSNGGLANLPILGENTTYAGGSSGSLAGTMTSGLIGTITAGNSGSTATIQTSLALEID
tara:strand:- start:47 stop:562 length:516 start_codon:yes stop_codon:yes gene_type:complete